MESCGIRGLKVLPFSMSTHLDKTMIFRDKRNIDPLFHLWCHALGMDILSSSSSHFELPALTGNFS